MYKKTTHKSKDTTEIFMKIFSPFARKIFYEEEQLSFHIETFL
jgi:hypothetical protein